MMAIFRRKSLARGAVAAMLAAAGLAISGEQIRAAIAAPIDPSRTSIEFIVDGVGWPRTKGRFTVFSGKITVDLRRPEASGVSFRVAAKSIDVGSSSFADYLRGDAFFDAARYPEITFVSTAVEKIDDRHARVSGDLTLRGVTHPFTVDVEVDHAGAQDNDRLNFRATGTVHRLEFGMNAGFPAISNDVDLIISTEAAAESP
ncbi:MAG TPA: YceI family protein [Roseiarcus sp.]|nr:YceI family protein [Roseiarcus sp.]